MNKVSHQKGWNLGTNPVHLEPPPIPPIKETCNGKSEKDFVKLKLRRYPMFSTSDLYRFKMSVYDHVKPEEFLLFMRNFNMNIAAIGTLQTDEKIQYLHTLLQGEELDQFDLLYSDQENIETLNVDFYIRSLALYFSL